MTSDPASSSSKFSIAYSSLKLLDAISLMSFRLFSTETWVYKRQSTSKLPHMVTLAARSSPGNSLSCCVSTPAMNWTIKPLSCPASFFPSDEMIVKNLKLPPRARRCASSCFIYTFIHHIILSRNRKTNLNASLLPAAPRAHPWLPYPHAVAHYCVMSRSCNYSLRPFPLPLPVKRRSRSYGFI